MTNDQDDSSYPRLLSVEEFAARVIMASVSGLFISLLLLFILQIQLFSIALNPNLLGPVLTMMIFVVLAYTTPKLYRVGIMVLGSYWHMARRDDISIDEQPDRKTTLFFTMFTISGGFLTYVLNRIWIELLEVPDTTILSAYRSGVDPLTFAQLALVVLAYTGSLVFTVAAGYTTLFRIKLRLFPDYFCPECGKEIKKDFTRCPYCHEEIDSPVNRRPYFRIPFGEDE